MAKAILGFIVVFCIFITISVGEPMLEVWYELFKLAIFALAISGVVVVAYLFFHFVGRIIVWIFKGFKDFWDN